MRAFADLPIRRKLSRAFMLTGTVVLVLTCSGFFAYEYKAAIRGLQESIATIAGITAGNSSAVVAFDDPEGAESMLAALRAESQIVAAGLYDRDGRLLATYAVDQDSVVPLSPIGPDGVRFESGRLVCVQPVVEGERRLGTLHVEATLARLYERLAIYGAVMLVVALLSVGIAWLLSTALQRRIARPILELADTTREITRRGDYALRAQPRGNDELGQLAESFNAMVAKIEASLAAQEQSAAEVRTLNAQLEDRVRERTAQLEEANKELESFSYSVSHDLRAPLRHVQGYAEMLTRAANGTLSDKARRYLEVITAASNDMAQLIDDLLAFSRMGRADLRDGVVDIARLVAEVRSSLEIATRGRNVHWHIAPLPAVRGDEAMIRQVLANLIGNAVKFTRQRQPAEIAVGCAGREDGCVVLYVRDNGVGFDMAYYEKLFGVFQRLHRAEDFEGTGIGLANVRRIITRHGGRVWAESTPDQGATFYFTLRTAAEAVHLHET